jgi:hypothetical protein
MHTISTKTHAIYDYIFGVVVVISPWIFGFSNQSVASSVAYILGASVLCYSLLTNYELSLFGILPMGVHLFFEFLVGVLLLASSWMLGMSGLPAIVFTVLGVISLVMTFHTRVSTAAGNVA